MAVEVKVPTVGEAITTGSIAQWHKQNGEQVKRGEVLYTLETDKITTEIEAEESGKLTIKVEEGAEVPIGAVVAVISPGEGVKEEGEGAAPAKENVKEKAAEKVPSAAAVEGQIERVAKAAEAAAAAMGAGGGGPALKVVPSPKTERAVEAAPAGKVEKAAPAKAVVEADGRVSRMKMTPLRKKIAAHLVSAQREAAILTTFNECDMSLVMDLRKQMQEAFVAKHGVKLGFMSFFIKAVVQGLKEVPQINSRIDVDEIVMNHYYDIGVAVGTERGLIVPVVRDCEEKSFAEIEMAIGEYATRARDGKIQFEDLQGGVFTISNGGIYGSMLSTPILNPPQSGILGMHTIMERPVAVEGEVVVRPMMYLALSYDHRIVDGKEAVTFLKVVKGCIEEPAGLFL